MNTVIESLKKELTDTRKVLNAAWKKYDNLSATIQKMQADLADPIITNSMPSVYRYSKPGRVIFKILMLQTEFIFKKDKVYVCIYFFRKYEYLLHGIADAIRLFDVKLPLPKKISDADITRIPTDIQHLIIQLDTVLS